MLFFSVMPGAGGKNIFCFLEPLIHLSGAEAASDNAGVRNAWPHEKSDIPPDPAAVFGKLDNGFGYVLMANHEPKNRVSMHLNVQTGSIEESDTQQGLAHFIEHMLFNGTKNFKPGEIVKYFQSIGMQFGHDANAHTGFNQTVYDMLLPDSGKKSLEQGFVVMRDFAEGALLLQSEIDAERPVILAEKRTRDSASYRSYVAKMKFEFPDARISRRFPIGIETVLNKADRPQLKVFYDTWYRPDKMILVMVGDFDVDMAAALIKEKFSAISSRAPPEPEPDLGNIHHEGIKPFYYFDPEAGSTEVSIEIVQRVPSTPDSVDAQSRRLMADVADRIVQNRLDALVGKAATPFTSASVGSGNFLKEIKYAEISAEGSPEHWEGSLGLIEQTLRKALEYGFAASELERVKKELLANLDEAVKKAATRNSRDLAYKIIGCLNEDKVFMSPAQERDLLAPMIKTLTTNQVHAAFKQTWSPGHRLVSVTGNTNLTGKAAGPDDQIRSVFNKSCQVIVSKPAESKQVLFPYLAEPKRQARILRQSKISDLGIAQVDFENGIRLNLKKTNFKADEVLVKLTFGAGRSAEPSDKPGLAELSTMVINESGFGQLTKEEIERALAGKSTTVVFGVGEDRFYFSGKTVSEEVLLLFQLLYAHLVDPGFRKDAYMLSMERFNQDYRELEGSIDGAMMNAGKRFLAGGDSRFGLPDHDVFKRLTLENVRSWFGTSINTKDIEVSVVGDFNTEYILNVVSKYLGNLPQKQSPGDHKPPSLPEFPANRSLRISVKTEIPKSLVVVAYPTEDLWNINRTRRLSILADIVSDRLREKIREKLGAAYSTFAFNHPSRAYPGYGVFQIMVQAAPREADAVAGVVKKLISDLAENGPSGDELERALAPTLTGIKDQKRKNDYWLNTVLSGSEQNPQQFEWCRTIQSDYAAITKEEISELAKHYLDNRKAATIIVKPEKDN